MIKLTTDVVDHEREEVTFRIMVDSFRCRRHLECSINTIKQSVQKLPSAQIIIDHNVFAKIILFVIAIVVTVTVFI